MQIRAENIGYNKEEMTACGRCGKRNPPNRVVCLYCAVVLDVPDDGLHGNLKYRKLENWERGYNIVIVPHEGLSVETAATRIGELFSLETETVINILERRKPFPIARLESDRHAETIIKKLEACGVKSICIPDAELANDQPPIRLRGIEFNDGELILHLFNSDQDINLPASDLRLIVSGAVLESKIEITHRRKSGKNEALDEVQSSNHESLIDLYTYRDRTGYRIRSGGFDFACLGVDKTILAAENLTRLISRLSNFALNIIVVDDYLSIRKELSLVWEPEIRKDSQGIQRSGMGKVNIANVATSSNLQQFTKYSRLQRYLL